MEAAYNEELANRIDEISKLSGEITVLKTTIEELVVNNNNNRLRRADSSLEFEILRDISKPQLEDHQESGESVQDDLMSELQNYDKKLAEKDLEISSFDSKLKEKEQTIEKQKQVIEFSGQFLSEIEAMNKMIEKKMRREKSLSQDDSLHHFQLPKESLEPETMQVFSQVSFRSLLNLIV